jgi:hypothetical protein
MLKLLSIACVTVFALGSLPAQAITPCGKRTDFLKTLREKFQEEAKAYGIVGKSSVLEVFTSKAGTWTMMVTGAEGRSCIIAAGNSWEELPQTKNLTSL